MDPMIQTKRAAAGAPRFAGEAGAARPTLLADALIELMQPSHTGLSQRYKAASQICSQWAQILPPELAQHCRVVDVSAGIITVEADSPSYLYELRISSQQLVQYLRQGCPSAKVTAMKVILAR